MHVDIRRFEVVYCVLSNLLGPVVPSFRALSRCLKLTVRRYKFNADSLLRDRDRDTLPREHVERPASYHARVFEGVAKSHFLLKAVIFKSQMRTLVRFLLNLPPPTLWRGTICHKCTTSRLSQTLISPVDSTLRVCRGNHRSVAGVNSLLRVAGGPPPPHHSLCLTLSLTTQVPGTARARCRQRVRH